MNGLLVYQLIYGDGLSAVFFLIVCSEIWNNIDNKTLKYSTPVRIVSTGAMLSLIIGLLALTKNPLASTFFFLLILLIPFVTKQVSSKLSMVLRSGLFLIISFTPYLLWRIFDSQYMLTKHDSAYDISYFLDKVFAPNVDMLSRIMMYFLTQVERFLFIFALSFALLLFARQKFLWRKATPALSILLFIIGYYAYVYNYGCLGCGDHESSLRYVMVMSLTLFYVGAESFEYILFARKYLLPIMLML